MEKVETSNNNNKYVEDDTLVRRAQCGDAGATEELLDTYQGLLLWHVGKEFRGGPLSKEDVLSIGYLTFLTAIRDYSGGPFYPYLAQCVRAEIKRERLRCSTQLAVPVRTLQLAKAKLGGYEQKASANAWRRADEYLAVYVSEGDAYVSGDSSTTHLDLVGEEDDHLLLHDTKVLLAHIDELPTQLRRVMGFVLQECSFADIAAITGVSRQRAHQQYKQALELLRTRMMGVVV